MKLKFVYKVLPAFIFYTDFLMKDWAAGMATGPFIRIRPTHKQDRALLVHELTHAKQFYRYLGIGYAVLYTFSKRFRLKMEVEAYREHLRHTDHPDAKSRAATALSKHYDLSVTYEEALDLLS